MVVRVMGTSAVSAQLSAEGAHREAVAEPPALCADGDPDAEHKFMGAVHKSAALESMQAESSLRVVDVKVHCTSVRVTRGSFNTGQAVLKEVDARLPRSAQD
jgi:hypothetical protein